MMVVMMILDCSGGKRWWWWGSHDGTGWRGGIQCWIRWWGSHRSLSSLSWPGSTTSTTKVAWLYFKTQNKGKLLCHYFQIWTSFQTIGQLLKTLTGSVQLCRDMLVTNMKLMRREKYVLPRNSFFWLIWRSGKFVGKSMERNTKIVPEKSVPRNSFF